MKKTLPIILAGVVLVFGLIGFLVYKTTQKPTETTQTEPEKKRRVSEPINAIAEDQRPYLAVEPLTDGRNIMVRIFELKKPATQTEYELEYQAGSLLQGAFGAIQLTTVPAEAKVLLGSCSAGGACTYHEDVRGGTIITRFKGDENYALKQDWKYIDNKTKDTEFSSKDAKFQIASAALKTVRYLTITNSPGYPGTPEGTVVSEHYALSTGGELKGTAKISIRARETGDLKIMGWDGSAWTAFPTTLAADDDKMAEAEVELLPLYLVVK
jgi:hypothetical protein